MAKRHPNKGLRKVMQLRAPVVIECKHPWHFNFKARGAMSRPR